MNGCDIICFDDILLKMKEFQEPKKSIKTEVVTIFKLLLVFPQPQPANAAVFSAVVCRKYGCVRRLLQPAQQGKILFSGSEVKTWLRKTMSQERFSNLILLNTHKDRTDKLCYAEVENEFADRNDNRK